MLCERCAKVETRHHYEMHVFGIVEAHDLCEECWIVFRAELVKSGQFLVDLAANDSRYLLEAYLFVQEAMVLAFERKVKSTGARSQAHVSTNDVLHSFRELALARLGKEAKSILNSWGLRGCEDVGEIIFKMVESGLLLKRDEDRLEDFARGYFFDSAFPEN